MSPAIKGGAIYCACIVLAAPIGVFVKDAGTLMAPLQIAAYRMLIGLVIVLAVAAITRRRPWRSQVRWAQLVRGVLSALVVWSWFTLYQHLSLAQVMAIGLMPPLIAVPLAGLILKEAVAPRQWLALVLSFAGCTLVVGTSIEVLAVWGIAALLVGLEAVQPPLLRHISKNDPPLTSIFYLTAVGSLVLLPFTDGQLPVTASAVPLILVAVLTTTTQFLNAWAYSHATVQTLAPLGYLQLALASLLDQMALGLPPSPTVIVGGILIIAASTLAMRGDQTATGN